MGFKITATISFSFLLLIATSLLAGDTTLFKASIAEETKWIVQEGNTITLSVHETASSTIDSIVDNITSDYNFAGHDKNIWGRRLSIGSK